MPPCPRFALFVEETFCRINRNSIEPYPLLKMHLPNRLYFFEPQYDPYCADYLALGTYSVFPHGVEQLFGLDLLLSTTISTLSVAP